MPVVQKFVIAKVLKLRQKIRKTNYEKVRSYYPASTRHYFDVERLILIKEKNKLIWTFIFFEIIVKIQICILFLFKKLRMLNCFLSANSSFKTKDSKRCKSRLISSPHLLKRHKFCKVSSAFPISSWVGLSIGSSNTSVISRLSSPLVSSSLSDRTGSRISSSVSGLSVVITFIATWKISWEVKSY